MGKNENTIANSRQRRRGNVGTCESSPGPACKIRRCWRDDPWTLWLFLIQWELEKGIWNLLRVFLRNDVGNDRVRQRTQNVAAPCGYFGEEHDQENNDRNKDRNKD